MKSKRLVALIMSLILMVIPMFVYGGMLNVKSTTVALLQDGNYDIEYNDKEYYKKSLISLFSIDNYQSFSQYMYDALLNQEEEIWVDNFNIPVSEFSSAFSKVINDNPDLFFVSSSVSYAYYNDGTTAYARPRYTVSKDDLTQARDIFNKGADKALAKVDDSMTDEQKALVLHDYICNAATYSEDGEISHSAYGFFYNGRIVCAGYTLAYSYLLKQAGIESGFVSSKDMAHAWNSVKIDGKWYNADLTYDDIKYDNVNIYGNYGHTNFLKSDSYFSSEAGMYHFGGETYGNPTFNSTSYDNYFWNKVFSQIIVHNGDYYYVQPASRSYLIKRDLKGNESNLSKSAFNLPKLTITSSAVDSAGTEHQISNTDYMGRLEFLDNRFYLTSATGKICSVAINGDICVIDSGSNDYIIGMTTTNNELTVQYYQNLATPVTYSKLEYFNNYMSKPNGNSYNNYPDIDYDGYINAKDYAMIKRSAS